MTGVIAIHCGLLPFGWMGVWLFFVVSGFAVTTSLFTVRHGARGVWDRIGNFYVRRALRIWPIYFAFLGANIIVLLALGKFGALQDVPWLLTFTENLENGSSPITRPARHGRRSAICGPWRSNSSSIWSSRCFFFCRVAVRGAFSCSA